MQIKIAIILLSIKFNTSSKKEKRHQEKLNVQFIQVIILINYYQYLSYIKIFPSASI